MIEGPQDAASCCGPVNSCGGGTESGDTVDPITTSLNVSGGTDELLADLERNMELGVTTVEMTRAEDVADAPSFLIHAGVDIDRGAATPDAATGTSRG